jgi:hypothetical protein
VLKGLSSGAVSVGTQRNTSAAGSGTSTSGQAQEQGQEQGNDGGMFKS